MINLIDGTLRFQVTRGDKKETWTSDVLELKLLAEELEAKHSLDKSSGFLVPTAAFLRELAAAYVEAGCPECGPTQAKQIWMLVASRFLDVAQHIDAELARSAAE